MFETIDVETGELIMVQKTMKDIFLDKVNSCIEHTLPDGRVVWVERGINLDSLGRVSKYQYSKVLGDIICQKIIDGGRLTKICGVGEIPPLSFITKWRKNIPEFDENLKAAEAARAEHHSDKIAEIVEIGSIGGIAKDEAPGYRLAMDGLSKMAESDNPGKYGRTKDAGKVSVNVFIDTGVPSQLGAGHEAEAVRVPVVEIGGNDKDK